jgi:hypothetical protein
MSPNPKTAEATDRTKSLKDQVNIVRVDDAGIRHISLAERVPTNHSRTKPLQTNHARVPKPPSLRFQPLQIAISRANRALQSPRLRYPKENHRFR